MNDKSKESIRIFVDWIKVKIRAHLSERHIEFNEGEIWWAALGHNIGVEANGKNAQFERPILVVRKFSRDSLWGIPISTQLKSGPYYFRFKHKDVSNCLNLSQIRLCSAKRLLRRVGHFPVSDFQEVRNKVKNMV